MVEAFSNETNYTVWNDLISNLGGVGAILQYSDCYPNFQAFGIKLYEPIGNKLGWDPVKGEGNNGQIFLYMYLSLSLLGVVYYAVQGIPCAMGVYNTTLF